MSGYTTPEGVIEEAARALHAYEVSTGRHHAEWGEFVETDEWFRCDADAVAPVIAAPAYATGYRAGLEAALDAIAASHPLNFELNYDGTEDCDAGIYSEGLSAACSAVGRLLAEGERGEG